jgi:hypothetical protein
VCRGYVATVRDAPSDLRTIAIEIGSIKCVLEMLELLATPGGCDSHSHMLLQLATPDGPLQGCKKTLAELENLFPVPEQNTLNGKRKKVVESLARLAWPLKQGRAQKLLDDIGRYRAIISLALTTETT